MYPTERLLPDRPRISTSGYSADKENDVLPTLRYSMAPAMEQASAAQMAASLVIVLKKDEEEDGSSAFIAISKKCKLQGTRGNASPDLIAPLFGCCLPEASNLLNTAQDFAVDKNSGVQQEQWDQQGLYLRLSNLWRVSCCWN